MSKSFADLGVSRAVAAALRDRGVHTPFPIQELVIADVLAGRDVLAKSPTGSGKTLAFGVPLIDRIAADARRPAALVLAPTRELAAPDRRRAAPAGARSRNLERGRRLRRRRLREADPRRAARAHPRRHPRPARGPARSAAPSRSATCSTLVLDEADRMLDMGFRPAVDRIVAQCPRERQTLFFSATLDGEAGRIAKAYTRDAARATSTRRRKQRTADIEHRFVRRRARQTGCARSWASSTTSDMALVFVRTKRGADRLVKRLAREGVQAVAMHGDKSQSQRERALAAFEAGRRRHAGGDRRRRPRHRRQRHLARHQLRPAGRPRGLRAPRRPHGPRRRDRRRHHLLRPRARARLEKIADSCAKAEFASALR